MTHEQRKNIKEIVLEKDHPLVEKLEKLPKNANNELEYEALKDLLLNIDKKAVDLTPYDDSRLTDINQGGHWDIYRRRDANDNTVSFMLEREIVAQSPFLSINNSGVVAIDFGTKSTVAGVLDSNSRKKLLRIGSGNIKAEQSKNDYENPTIMEFIDIEGFKKDYFIKRTRPLTSWKDISISHTAESNLRSAKDDDFYRFFSNLKQWANSSNNIISVMDEKNKIEKLKNFKDCTNEDFNPIEFYAYFIGRYINNMRNGIYINYLLSFPVKYEKAVRDKICESFERGIKKSLPNIITKSGEVKIKVELRASEPAAYAISALKEYGFENIDENEKIHYGVFDFGGGTTDFDFGIWQLGDDEKGRYDYKIEHFAADGDVYLGGERLLEILAYEVFKSNKETMRQYNCAFTKPENEQGFGGDETLIKNTQDARKNTAELVSVLRFFWENIALFDDGALIDDSEINKRIDDFKVGKIEISLNTAQGEVKTLALEIDIIKLRQILKDKIANGVKKFFECFKNDASSKMPEIEKFHIFLGGNASRSPLVKEAFLEAIDKIKTNVADLEIALYPPLGTPEAEDKREELGLEADLNDDLSTKITCKTGVVFGLLDSRKSSKIEIISQVGNDDEARFTYFLGIEKRGKFKMIVDKNSIDVLSRDKKEFLSYADIDHFELYYTNDPRASGGYLDIKEKGVKRKVLALDQVYGENDRICIQIIGANTIKYFVIAEKDNSKTLFESKEIDLRQD